MSSIIESGKEILETGAKKVKHLADVAEKEVSYGLHQVAGVTVKGAQRAACIGVVGMEFVGRSAAEAKMIITDDEYHGRLNPFEEGSKAVYSDVKAVAKDYLSGIPVVGDGLNKLGAAIDSKIREHFDIDEHQGSYASFLEDSKQDMKQAALDGLVGVKNKLLARREAEASAAPDQTQSQKMTT